MKKASFLLLLLLACPAWAAVTLMVDTNGLILAPTNFANTNKLLRYNGAGKASYTNVDFTVDKLEAVTASIAGAGLTNNTLTIQSINLGGVNLSPTNGNVSGVTQMVWTVDQDAGGHGITNLSRLQMSGAINQTTEFGTNTFNVKNPAGPLLTVSSNGSALFQIHSNGVVNATGFTGDGSGLTGLANGDLRPTSVQYVKGATVSPTNDYVLFTNAGPCTINEIGFTIANGGWACLRDTHLTIWADGVSNGCSVATFFAIQGMPYQWNNNPRLQAQVIAAAYVSGERMVEIHAFTNAGVTISTTNTSMITYPQILYSIGTPTNYSTTRKVWHIQETNFPALAASGTATVFSVTNVAGEIEWQYQYTTAPISVADTFLEAMPAWYNDGLLYGYGGTEDWYKRTYYGTAPATRYGDPGYSEFGGWQQDACLREINPRVGYMNYYGISGFRYFAGINSQSGYPSRMVFNTGSTFYWSNVTASSLSNIFAVSYWTTK